MSDEASPMIQALAEVPMAGGIDLYSACERLVTSWALPNHGLPEDISPERIAWLAGLIEILAHTSMPEPVMTSRLREQQLGRTKISLCSQARVCKVQIWLSAMLMVARP